jgi:hypothetical protein
MKKMRFTLFTLLVSCSTAFAQEVGLRAGNNVGNYLAFDAIFSVGDYSRIHTDVSVGRGLGVEAVYDFVYQPFLGDRFLYWYAGVGVSAFITEPVGLGANGEIGLQYTFEDVPLSLGMDWRPVFWFIRDKDYDNGNNDYSTHTALNTNNFGISVRYMLGRQ